MFIALFHNLHRTTKVRFHFCEKRNQMLIKFAKIAQEYYSHQNIVRHQFVKPDIVEGGIAFLSFFIYQTSFH